MDFQKLKDRVEKERDRRLKEGEARGDTMVMPQGAAPKDSLLHELQISLQTGKPTPIVENMKKVNEVANTKKGKLGNTVPKVGGGGLTDALTQHIGTPPRQQQPSAQTRQHINEVDNARDSAFDQQFQRPQTSNASLSDQLAQMGGNQSNPMTGNPMMNNPQMMQAYEQMLRQQQAPAQPHQQPQQQSNPVNINEQVNAAINQLDFGALLQESLKSTVMEMYAMEKVQKAIVENKDLIKKMIKETLIELSQAKKKTGK